MTVRLLKDEGPLGDALAQLHEQQARLETDPAYRAECEKRYQSELAARAQAEDDERRSCLKAREIPGRIQRTLLDESLDWSRPALAAAKRFWDDPRKCLLILAGGRGCGKSTAAGWLVAQAPRVAYDGGRSWPTDLGPRFVLAPALTRWPRFDAKAMRQLLECATLAVDDLALEFADASGAAVSLLEEVVVTRHGNMLPTVLTGNITPAEFRERFGERIWDRRLEDGAWCNVHTESLRGKAP